MFKRFFFNQQNKYSRWDGTQQIEGIDAEDILNAMADDYLRDNDLQSALRRMQMQGFEGRNGQRMMGLQEMMERLRQQQQSRMRQYNVSGVMDDIREQLDKIKQHERDGIQRRLDETDPSRQPGDQSGNERQPQDSGAQPGDQQSGPRNQSPEGAQQSGNQSGQQSGGQTSLPEGVDPSMLRKMLEQMAQKKRDFLDQLPRDPGGQIRELSEYDFMDAQARQEFEDLKQMLQQQVMQQYFNGMQQSLSQMTPEDLLRMRQMIQALNQMLRDRENGIEPDFDSFMQQYGDFFGPGINTLDDLIEDMNRRMAQMQAVMDSMSPEQREQLQQMMAELMGDADMQADLAELAQHIGQQSRMDYRTQYRMSGDESLSLSEAMQMMGELQGLDELESQMNAARRRGNLEGVDTDRMRQFMGEDEAAAMDELKNLMRQLEDAGLIQRNGNRWELTSHGIRKIGQKALQDMFGQLSKDAFGQHETEHKGGGGERTDESKPYVFGDPFLLDLNATLRKSIERTGPGTPVKLTPDDFEVYRTELITQSSTVLMIDMSLSMIYSGASQAAKKVAVALESLIRGQFPRDNLYVVGFSRTAREFKPEELVEISEYDHSQGTNMVHGIMLARQLLARHRGVNKQIIMVTDGGPTVMWDKELEDWLFTYPYTQPAELQTLLEVQRATRDGVKINTFMLVHDQNLVGFVNQMSEINKGRAFFTEPENLGRYVLVDYLASKQVYRHG